MTIALIVIGVVVIFAARMYFAGHQTPTGQPPLADLSEDSVASLKAQFNHASDGIRIILLLSPT